MPANFKHEYAFDPSYGYTLEQLQQSAASAVPEDFEQFWSLKYQRALQVKTHLNLQDTGRIINHWRIFDCYYDSTDNTRIGGWLLLPEEGRVNGAVVWAHGYGGIDEPDTSWKLKNTAMLIPCVRGISRSAHEPISTDPYWHVLHDVQDKYRYIIGGCVQDLWCGISALLSLFPHVEQNIGMIGSSLGGGLGTFASAFDKRIKRSHLHVPTFGNSELRLTMPTVGSTQALIEFPDKNILNKTLPYFDASCAARFIRQPSHWALAKFDPYVAPPGQFSIYNGCTAEKHCFILDAGHFIYRGEGKQRRELRKQVEAFFAVLGEDNAS
ncbi:acetylxylan esterase [Vibrio sp. SCSIO 43136]|uniref:acetylxylan esterase n=1 Tax=Vibrio sp. SCSIO 43136 TaxID=2819101 RepID=UPI002074D4C9|nr:acetylxylan esterase [Vibrio sp. SCSIO 43136]USD64176.1 acetylxylan esterase [Vibrio sp. SCSIO 43136]